MATNWDAIRNRVNADTAKRYGVTTPKAPTVKKPTAPKPTATITPTTTRAADTTPYEQEKPAWLSGSLNTGGGGGGTSGASDYYSRMLAEQQRALEQRTQSALDANNAYIPQINEQSDQALQNAYINSQLARINTPQALSAMGYTGGAAESTLLGLDTNYQNNRNNLERQRFGALENIYNNERQIRETGNAQLSDMAAKYYSDLAAATQRENELAMQQSNWQDEFNASQTQQTYENQLAEARLRASLGDYEGLQALGYNAQPEVNRSSGSTGSTRTSETAGQYYGTADRILSNLTIPSSQLALIKQYVSDGRLSETEAEELLRKYGIR